MTTSRRVFLVGGGASILLGSGFYAWLRHRGYEVDGPIDPRTSPSRPKAVGLPHPAFDPAASATLAVLVDDLLPGAEDLGIPDARSLGVSHFVGEAARSPGFQSVRADILKLLRHLDLAAKDTGGSRFVDLHPEARGEILARIASGEPGRGSFNPGSALELTLRLALEGYLGHPHHGGNRDGLAWRALGIAMPLDRGPFGQGHHHDHSPKGVPNESAREPPP
ncbi:MAG: gluconate 2-dehydrogenase subunit 3 family protein [Deltaproteobacteria bacterium]|nr:gluconate 2-dehydrogenase subunit 3 family protein [Deltaproteobacteria bacterium]